MNVRSVEERMDEPRALEALKAELDKQLRIFSARRRRDKRKSTALQMATVSLSAMITVFLGLRVDPKTESILTNVALGLGVTVTILAAYDSFFDHRKLWVMRTITVRRLEELRRELDYRSVAPEENINELSNFIFSQLNQILADDRREWLQMRNQRNSMMPWETLWMPNWPSTAVTCGIAGRWPSSMIVDRGDMTAVSDLPAGHGLAWTADPQRTIEECGDPCTPSRSRRVAPPGEQTATVVGGPGRSSRH